MLLSILLASAAVINTVAARTTVNCASFWPSVAPGQSGTLNENCIIYPGFPTTIGIANVTFAYVQSFSQDPNPAVAYKVDTLAALITQSLSTSIPVFQSYQDNIADVVLILSDENMDSQDDPADTGRPEVSMGPCEVRLFFGWWGNEITDNDRLDAIAHEMYHCAQETMFDQILPEAWWVEGTAEYFATVVYPTLSYDKNAMQQYTPELALWNNYPYSTNIFFQAMTSTYGPVGINNWVRQTSLTDGSAGAERTRLSTFPNFADDFYNFAQQFSLGTIYDTSYKPIPIANPVSPQSVTLNSGVPLAEATVGTVSLTVNTGTITVFGFELDGGQTVSLSYSTQQSNVRVGYTLSLQNSVWSDVPADQSASAAEGVLVAPCNTDGSSSDGSVIVYVLVTSTDDVDQAVVDITVTQQSADETCPCPGSSSNAGGSGNSGGSSDSGGAGSDSSSGSGDGGSGDGGSGEGGSGGSKRGLRRRGLDRCPTSSVSSSAISTSASSSMTTTTSSSSVSTTPSSMSTSTPTPTPNPSNTASGALGCTPVAAFPSPDPCLASQTWNIDTNALQSLMEQKLADEPAVTVNSISITGSGTLAISASGNATFVYTDFTINLDIEAAGLDVPTTTIINGAFKADLYMQDASNFCLAVYSGEGSADESDPITGGFSFDLGPGGGFVEERMRVNYQCRPGTLNMQGALDGVADWGPYAYH